MDIRGRPWIECGGSITVRTRMEAGFLAETAWKAEGEGFEPSRGQ